VDELAPSQDLADKALHGVERGLSLPISLFRGLDALLWGEQAEVKKGGEDGVEKNRLAFDHGVFPRSELAKPGSDKMPQPFEGAFAGGRDP